MSTAVAASLGDVGPDQLAASPSRALRYAVLRAAYPGKSKAWAARSAGYSKGSLPAHIERCGSVQQALQTVSQYREQLQQCPDASLGAMVAQLLGIVQATETERDPKTGRRKTRHIAPPRDRVAAIKQVSTMLGYDAPTQVQADVRGLMMEFTGLTSADLASVAAAARESHA